MARSSEKRTAERSHTIRCAIYTRKSSEEGLEQDYNSLDAQRDACEAFILSQKHEGWVCLPEKYDDGGISGGTMERPALKRLLADIVAGRIDTVVVYKVDRLTRSLGDFAKIVDVFDRQGASFVSVTQQFNTTTSMGRLTLNMLLSFAQFEREVTGERIRDKIAASKKKGLWMGGLPPLGYDVEDRKLIVNATEAETVRNIFERYAELGSVRKLRDSLDRVGIVSKVRLDRFGRTTGGKPLARGALYLMLQNRIYRGEIVHKDTSYPGQHDAIVDEQLWDAVQHRLEGNRVNRSIGATAAEPSLLAGLVYDEDGTRLTPNHANKKGTRYRYYVSPKAKRNQGNDKQRNRRVPAADLEAIVEDRLIGFLTNRAELFTAIENQVDGPTMHKELLSKGCALAQAWPNLDCTDRRTKLTKIVERIDLLADALEIRVVASALIALLIGHENEAGFRSDETDDHSNTTLTVPVRLKRAGIEMRLLVEGEQERRTTDHSLHRLLAQAHRFRTMAMQGSEKTISELAAEAGVGGSYFTRVLRLGFLAPDVVKDILRDRHPADVSANILSKDLRLPISWQDQRRLILGD